MQAANAIDSLLLTSAFHWASERILLQAALYTPEPLQPWNRPAIEADRRTADGAFLDAMGRIEDNAREGRLAQPLDEARDLHARIIELRGRLDATLETAFDGRDELTLSDWFPAMTQMIATNQRLQQQSRYRASAALRDLEVLQRIASSASGPNFSAVGGKETGP